MFNNYNTNTNVKINAVTGTIVKNYKDSFFKCFHINSNMADHVFDTENPYLMFRGNKKPIVLLQTMLCSDERVICEIMWKTDFEKLFENT